MRVLVVLGVAWLAAQGLDVLVRGPRPSRFRLWALLPVLGMGAIVGALVVRAAHRLATDPAQVGALDRDVLVAVGMARA